MNKIQTAIFKQILKRFNIFSDVGKVIESINKLNEAFTGLARAFLEGLDKTVKENPELIIVIAEDLTRVKKFIKEETDLAASWARFNELSCENEEEIEKIAGKFNKNKKAAQKDMRKNLRHLISTVDNFLAILGFKKIKSKQRAAA